MMRKIFLLLALLLPFLSAGCPQQTDPRDRIPADNGADGADTDDGGLPLDSLVNSRWVWDSPWGGRTLTFISENEVIYRDQHEGAYTETYTYEKSKKTGKINYYGEFEIRGGNRIMHFIEWKNYGHSADFLLAGEQDGAE